MRNIQKYNLSYEQMKFTVFRNFFDLNFDRDTLKYFNELKLKDTMFAIYGSLVLRGFNKDLYEIRRKEKGILIEQYYNRLLEDLKKLSEELNLSNSLEISNLFSYLLYSGYLSKTKTNEYNSKDRKKIEGLYYASVMDGVAVCINHADMLSDFINKCGFDSTMIICSWNHDNKIPKLLEKLLKITGDHAITLISENGNLYAYDVTNMLIYRIINPYTFEIINGTGVFNIHPYFSYSACYNQNEKNAIEQLFFASDYSSPYDSESFINISERNVELFRNSIALFEDFYDEVRPNILRITKETDEMKRVRSLF